MVVFTNIGFMGIPMIQGLYGTDALIYISLFLIPFNLLFYSYAMKIIRGNQYPFRALDLINSGMIACVVAIVVYFSGIRLPYVISTSIMMVGSMTAPLAMMLIGSFLYELDWMGLVKDWRTILFSIVKMIVIPVIIVYILGLFTRNILLLAVCMAALATPSGNVLVLLASMYNKEAYPIALNGIALTTVISVITMPIAFYLAGLN